MINLNKQIKFGIILQYAQMFLSILINLIYTPIMIRILGQSEYGIYNLASSIISYLSLLSLGFGSSYIRFYSRYKANDEKEIKKLNGLYLIVFSFIGIVALIAGFFISNNVSIFFNSTYSDNDLYIARILMIFLTINLAISFPASVFVSYITSQEKFIFQKIINIGKTVVSPILSVLLLFLGYGSIGMVIITTFVSIVIDIMNIIYCFKKLNMKVSFGKIDWRLLKEIAIFSIFIALNSIIDQINWQTDKVILGKMVNSSAVAVYAVASTINTMYINFSNAISSVFAPKINAIVAGNKENMDEKLNEIFIKVGRMQFFVVLLILSGFIFFGKYFVIKWVGKDYQESYYVALILMIPMLIPLTQNAGIEIRRAKNMHKEISVISFGIAIFNVILTILLVPTAGVKGAALGTCISIVVNCIIINIFCHKKVKLNMIKFWKEIFKMTPIVCLTILSGLFIRYIIDTNNFVKYMTSILLYLIFYVIILLINMSKNEKKIIFNFLRRKSDEKGIINK